ncbi:MAG: hypothetical protein JRI23_16465 [Deltaproteobacteria bacterium]|jgi:hypothetical protein|nr:hypothetical protein [Deltaproteobacteria bacterium]MBW2533370.1 hypothetical protein [Deltaproteobacteria bacterium]
MKKLIEATLLVALVAPLGACVADTEADTSTSEATPPSGKADGLRPPTDEEQLSCEILSFLYQSCLDEQTAPADETALREGCLTTIADAVGMDPAQCCELALDTAPSYCAAPDLRYECLQDVPNGSWPDVGPERVDRFAFENLHLPLGSAGQAAYWTSFDNQDAAEPVELTIDAVRVARCPHCYDVELSLPGDGQPYLYFKVTLRSDPTSGIVSTVETRSQYDGPDDWVPHGDGDGACELVE